MVTCEMPGKPIPMEFGGWQVGNPRPIALWRDINAASRLCRPNLGSVILIFCPGRRRSYHAVHGQNEEGDFDALRIHISSAQTIPLDCALSKSARCIGARAIQ